MAKQEKQWAELADGEVIDPRLDNRTGTSRPSINPPPVPQQVDGPDILHQKEWERLTGPGSEAGTAVAGSRRGMFSAGPHGRGEVEPNDSGGGTYEEDRPKAGSDEPFTKAPEEAAKEVAAAGVDAGGEAKAKTTNK